MAPFVYRWSGLALVLGSLLFILNKLDDMGRVFLNRPIPDLITGHDRVLITVGQALMVIGLGGYLGYAKRCNRAGKIGLFLLVSGAIFLALGHVTFTPIVKDDSLFALVILGIFLMVVGLTTFGAVNLRSHVIRYWQPLPLTTGLLGIAAFFLYGSDKNPLMFLALRTLFGTGLVLMGVVLVMDTRAVTALGKQTGDTRANDRLQPTTDPTGLSRCGG